MNAYENDDVFDCKNWGVGMWECGSHIHNVYKEIKNNEGLKNIFSYKGKV